MNKLVLALMAMGMMATSASANIITQSDKPVIEKKQCCKEKKKIETLQEKFL